MLDWILNNWNNIFSVIGIVGVTCTAIVKAFGNVKWASVLVNICDKASVINTPANKEIIEKYNNKKKK